ncbi:glutamyl-tRNA amidotransferase [Echria macrotheca]|uniref:Glutamyl-tRNA(Gln) amidotransferase subunit A, mitochondrial n=1 Tax=Echria macrotheca TaxID=438768 RepID=A0AAJ0F7Z4_9PEZI|nr:glutamyl-tRNA amidotransferase [Echria macrotheca]
MSSSLIPANPSAVMVIRDVTPNVVTLSVPFLRFGKIPVGGRGTIVRLTSGALAVFSPVALTPEVKAKVESLGGNVQYLIAPDMEHHIFISDWAKAYPAAKLIGPDGLPEKRKGMTDEKIGKEEFAVVYKADTKRQTSVSAEFDADFEVEYVDGHANKEIVLFYKPEGVLIEADLMFNLPPTEQYSRVPEAERPKPGLLAKFFSSAQTVEGKGQKRLLWHAISRGNRLSFNESVQRIDKWDIKTIVPCHGDVIEKNAKGVFDLRHSEALWQALSHSATQPQRRLLNHYTSQDPNPQPPPPIPNNTSTRPFTLAVKDNIATTSPSPSPSPSLPTTCASPFLKTYHSPIEATIVTQLRSRGAVVIGKTNLDEFGMGSHSTHSAFGAVSHNGRSAGGSSGGSAVAVATGEVDLALGTDTGGSVRLPAAYTGVVGFKPSYGMVSRFGVVPYANSLDTVAFLATTVKRVEEVVVGTEEEGVGVWVEGDKRDPTCLSGRSRRRLAKMREGYGGTGKKGEWGLEGLVFGLPVEYNIFELDARIRAAWVAAAEALVRCGARVVPVSLPTTRQALAAYYVIAPAEASSNLAKYDGVRYGTRISGQSDAAAGGVLYAASRDAGFGEEVKRRILLGSYTLSSAAMDNYFLRAQAVRRLVRRDFDRVFRLGNPLVDDDEGRQQFDLSDLDEAVPMRDKLGPEEVDFLVCPTAPTTAPRLERVLGDEGDGEGDVVDAYVNDVFTVPASLAGLPAVSLPVGVVGEDGKGKDVAGLQVIGQYWDDARLLGVAGRLEEVLSARGTG